MPEHEEITVASFADRWLRRTEASLKPQTRVVYRAMLDRYILPGHGDRILATITTEDAWDLLADLRRRLSVGTTRNACMVYHAIMEAAVYADVIARNPLRGLSKRMKLTIPARARGDAVKALSAEETLRLLDAIAVVDGTFTPILTLMVLTGLRPGEATSLRWDDLDLARHRLHVRRTRQRRIEDTLRYGPKSNASRAVDLNDDACALLASLARHPSGWLFPNPRSGRPYDVGTLARKAQRARRLASLPEHITPHCLCHTWTTLLLEDGVDLFYVARQGGWSTIELPASVYARWLQPHDVQRANRLAAILRRQRVGSERPLLS